MKSSQTFLKISQCIFVNQRILFSIKLLFRMDDPQSAFLDRCSLLAFRHWMRLLIELVLFFILPVIVSAFFYVKIAVRLIKRNKQAGRNHVLTLAFALSWLFWVICWTPNAFVLAKKTYNDFEFYRCQYEDIGCEYEYGYEYGHVPDISRFELVLSYALVFRIPFQLLYSHLNPLLYLLVLKKFQQLHIDFVVAVFRFFFSTQRNSDLQSFYSRYRIFHWGFEFSKVLKSLLAGSSIILIVFSLITCTYQGVGFTQKVSHVQRVSTETMNKLNTQRSFLSLQYYSPIRSFCADHNGIINVDYRRCFLLSTHLPRYLNFTAHLEYCEQEGTTMCYPRSHAEMRFMYRMLAQWAPENVEPRLPWRLLTGERKNRHDSSDDWYLEWIENKPLQHYHIHVGFIKKGENLFTSIDGQFNISSQTHSWFQSKYSKRPYFVGPSVCLSQSLTTLWECTPSWRTPETFCCKDFFYKTALRIPS